MYLHRCLIAQWNCGRGPCRVSVPSEVQFAAYALVKMTLCLLFNMTLYLQSHSQIHRASYMKSAVRKSRTGKSLVSGFKSKWKIQLNTGLWAFQYLNSHISPVFRTNRSLHSWVKNCTQAFWSFEFSISDLNWFKWRVCLCIC